MKKEKGSMVLEASLVFPLVIIVMLGFSILIRYFVVYETFQHGMYETTRQMSSYYYIYSAIGLEEAQNEIQDVGREAQENLDMLIEPFNTTINTVTNISNALTGASSAAGSISADPLGAVVDGKSVDNLGKQLEKLTDNIQQLPDNIGDIGAAIELIGENPLETLTYVIKSAGANGVDSAFNLGMNLVACGLMNKHIPGGIQTYASLMGIEGMKTRVLWNSGGAQGEIQMIWTYEFVIHLFDGLKLNIVQKTATRGWGVGV